MFAHTFTINWEKQNTNQDQEFENEKWYYFLKGILLSRDLLYKTAAAYRPMHYIHVEKQIDRIDNLKILLINIEKFKKFISNNHECIDKICKEFNEYNDQLNHDLKKSMAVDISQIRTAYHQLVKQMEDLVTESKSDKMVVSTVSSTLFTTCSKEKNHKVSSLEKTGIKSNGFTQHMFMMTLSEYKNYISPDCSSSFVDMPKSTELFPPF